MDPKLLVNLAETFGAVFCVSLGCAIGAFAQSRVISGTCEAMSRQPELAGELRFTMIIGLAMIESLAIYCLLVSLILLLVKW